MCNCYENLEISHPFQSKRLQASAAFAFVDFTKSKKRNNPSMVVASSI